MRGFMTNGKAYIAVWLMIISLIPSMLGIGPAAFTVEDPENVLFKAAFISDIHTRTDYVDEKNDVIRRGLADMRGMKCGYDCIVMTGDNTNCGWVEEYKILKRFVKFYCWDTQVIPAMGNHDSWGETIGEDFSLPKSSFIDFCAFNGIKTDKTYYSTEVKGYRFIIMGTEDCSNEHPLITDTQLEWLDAELTSAEETGKPVFVVCHEPLNNRHGRWYAAGVGDCYTRINEILESHANPTAPVVMLSGHIHSQNERSFEKGADGLYFLSIPSFLWGYNESYEADGFVVEIYEHEILMRLRNFTDNSFVDEFSYSIEY